MSMYGEVPADVLRPRPLNTFVTLLLPLLPATLGTIQVAGSVSLLDPVPR